MSSILSKWICIANTDFELGNDVIAVNAVHRNVIVGAAPEWLLLLTDQSSGEGAIRTTTFPRAYMLVVSQDAAAPHLTTSDASVSSTSIVIGRLFAI